MASGVSTTHRYDSLRRTGTTLARSASVISFGIWALGLGQFFSQARELLSDAQFTWGERQVMAAIAAVTIGGSLLAGWIAGRLIKAGAELIHLLADMAEASIRRNELLERHIIAMLGRISSNPSEFDSRPSPPRSGGSSASQPRARPDREPPTR